MVIVQKLITDLVFADYNPREMTDAERKDLNDSISKFGIVDPAVVNVNPERMNVVIGGHQRIRDIQERGYKYMPCVELNLSLEDERELNLRLNHNHGHWDSDMLKKHFSRDELKTVGFLDSELEKLLKDDAAKMQELGQEPTFPIVPRVDEGYDGVIVFCKSKIDFLWLKEFMGLHKAASYKCEAVGETRVVALDDFRERLNAYMKEHAK